VKRIAEKFARLGWVVEVFCPSPKWADLAPGIRQLDPRVKIIAGHVGGTYPGEENGPGFAAFLDLLREGKVYTKLSGLDRFYYGKPGGIDSMEGIVKKIVEAGPGQIVFGSDWPHTGLGALRGGRTEKQRIEEVEAYRDVDVGLHLRKLREWIPDEGTWRKLWVETPERLFG